MGGLVLSATIYHIWRERNWRLHNQRFSCTKKIKEDIVNAIRERLCNLEERDGLGGDDLR
ncbi:hypothetical protein OIU76_028841, partial [Salix suchowensis]